VRVGIGRLLAHIQYSPAKVPDYKDLRLGCALVQAALHAKHKTILFCLFEAVKDAARHFVVASAGTALQDARWWDAVNVGVAPAKRIH
jgi:hypothetical protein